MGGRMATLIENKANIQGVICYGFPFHAPGKPPKDRIDHLKSISYPLLIIQGTRDSMGNQKEVSSYDLSKRIIIHWLSDGDHSFKPRVKSGLSLTNHLSKAAELTEDFIKKLSGFK